MYFDIEEWQLEMASSTILEHYESEKVFNEHWDPTLGLKLFRNDSL